nr:hypothetical protein [uncultured Mediterraneibacter sp.]
MTEEIFTGQIDHIGMCEPGKLIIYKKHSKDDIRVVYRDGIKK